MLALFTPPIHSVVFLYLSQIEVAAIRAGAKRSSPFEFNSWDVSVAAIVVCTKYLGQFRSAKFCEILVVRASDNIHSIFALFLRIEHIFKSAVRPEHLLCQRVPDFDEQTFHAR